MRVTKRWMAIAVAVALFMTGCSSSSSPEVDTAADPVEVTPRATPEPTAVLQPTSPPEPRATVQPTPEPSATPEPTPTPAPTSVPVLSTGRNGEFTCSNQEPLELDNDAALAADLEDLIGPGVPGIVAASASSDGLLRVAAAGVRSVGTDDLMLSSDRLHLGSDTKSMTGALLAILAEENNVGLESLVSEIWPDSDSGWDGVTLLDLLRHRGGAEDSLGRDQGALWGQLWDASTAAHSGTTAQRAAAAVRARSLLVSSLTSAAPTETVGQFSYSNSGYIMVGAALEAVTGQPWEELMCEHLFQPLRMDGCGFGGPQAPAPAGHNGQAGALSAVAVGSVGSDNPFSLGPAGTVHCPIADWAKYLSWVLRGAQGEDDILSAETWQQLLEPDGTYASGWGVQTRPWAPGPIFSHAGSNTMWFAIAWVAPGNDRAYFAVANAATTDAQAATDAAVGRLIEAES